MILLIDNYDSFAYNIYQLVGEFQSDITVVRNDELTSEQVQELAPSHIILSPGPGRPCNAGICIDLVKKVYKDIPLLGICLGHQAICEAFGARISYAKELIHGKSCDISIHNTNRIFKGLPHHIKVARYHSLAALKETMPKELEISATAEDGDIMAVAHCDYPLYGVQFHPESILTPDGKTIMQNFLAQ